jgi:hypothetical protein
MNVRELTTRQLVEYQELKELGWSTKKIFEEVFKIY